MSIEEIKNRLHTEDLVILNLCNNFLDKRQELERLRGESAERRSSVILGTVGASAAILVFLASHVLAASKEPHVLEITIYVALVLWLARAVWYSIKSNRIQNRYQLSEESIFEFQSKSELDAMKDIIAGKLWEYQRSVQPNTERLFYAQRAQRALIIFVGWLLVLGLVVLLIDKIEFLHEVCVISFISIVAAAFWLFGDWLIEKVGIWHHD